MIIVRLMGGLGNQMFQYAAARMLADFHKVDLRIDHSFFQDSSAKENFTFRKYELNNLKICALPASEADIKRFLKPSKIIPKIIFKLKNITGIQTIFNEATAFEYTPEFKELPSHTYLYDGYWQNELYFKDIRETLLAEFTLDPLLDVTKTKTASDIMSTTSIAIHVRRGDYIHNAHINSYYGVCSSAYYNQAISIMAEKLKDPVFYIFSDELDWARDNLKIGFPVCFIDENKFSCQDSQMMSFCKHNIIANSSFSWWAAWLNTNKEKIVIGPKVWMTNLAADVTPMPKSWIRI